MNQTTTQYQLKNFIIFSPPFKANVGGVIALYNLARIIDEAGFACKVFDMNGLRLSNNIFDKYATETDVNEKTIVVYPEVVFGNPLNAKYVARWILCELGIHCPHDIYKTWGKDDFVYHHGTYNTEKDVKNYNILAPLYLNSVFKNHGRSRNGYCHIIRKGHKFHKPLKYIHPPDSLFLDDNLSQEILSEVFNVKEYLISYDPYSYNNFFAALCGCIPIIVPIAGTTKKGWLKSSSLSIILEEFGEHELKGIAYGTEEIEYARNTLEGAKYQQDISIQYGKTTVHRFLNDMISIVYTTSNISTKNDRILRVKDVFPIDESKTNIGDIQIYLKDLFRNSISKIVDKEQEIEYLEFLFASHSYFKQISESGNYYLHLQRCIDCLHTSIFNNLDSEPWQEITKYFIQSANFIPAYFNEANLKDIYIKRAEILELFLKNNGCEVDYEFPARPVNRKKIRLGVLAAHFTPGSETFAYLPVYEYINRDFEVILYSLQETNHPLEQYCRSCANSFKLLPRNLLEQVNTIRADDLDILFIATNVTAVTNQICLLATHRLARIQATSGGSVVTTGMRHMDYYISGTLTDPSPTAQEHYREKLVKLEGTAHCFSYGCEEEKATAEVDRENLGISEEAVIFISGANFFKIVPELIHTWAKIIAEVPNSVLVLLPFGPNWSNAYPKQAFENNLNQVFSQYGISAERLIILDPQPVPNREDIKEYFKIADIYLDSYPFSGTTSLIEPLQVNLPVIARQGNTFRSAMGAAMARSLDLSDLVADSEETYIQLAVKLGTNPELRQQKSDRIKQKMQQNPSFLDSRSYSAQMGTLFQQLFQQYQANNLIEQLGLRDINLVMFPNWHQSEESLYEDFANVLKTMSSNPDKSRMTLLIDTDGIDGEDANWLFSSVAMNLLMEEAVDIADDLEVSLLDDLTENEWELLLSLLQGRIVLDNENQNAIAKNHAESLPIYS
jgi:predicted O-linked N-acetylglucosamine transferase (SPINDLY family)